MKILDTSAWIEYFKGSKKGIKIKNLIENSCVHTSAISLAELSKWFYQNGVAFDLILEELKNNSNIIPLDEFLLIQSGKNFIDLRKIKKKIGLIDTIIYTAARTHNLALITTDQDFSDLVDVEIIT